MFRLVRVIRLAVILPALQLLLGKGVGYGTPVLEPADIINITREDYDKFRGFAAEADFRQAVLEAGFSITENPPHFEALRIEVRRHDDWGLNSSGPTLATALNAFRVQHRDAWQEAAVGLQGWWLYRLQAECPHDAETYTRDNPLMEYCSTCHKQV